MLFSEALLVALRLASVLCLGSASLSLGAVG